MHPPTVLATDSRYKYIKFYWTFWIYSKSTRKETLVWKMLIIDEESNQTSVQWLVSKMGNTWFKLKKIALENIANDIPITKQLNRPEKTESQIFYRPVSVVKVIKYTYID